MTTYYKTTKEHQAYKGKRFFKVNDNANKCVQVCVWPGETKKGVANCIGIYTLDTLGFYTNYMGPSYAERCTKKEFDKYFEEIIKILTQA